MRCTSRFLVCFLLNDSIFALDMISPSKCFNTNLVANKFISYQKSKILCSLNVFSNIDKKKSDFLPTLARQSYFHSVCKLSLQVHHQTYFKNCLNYKTHFLYDNFNFLKQEQAVKQFQST